MTKKTKAKKSKKPMLALHGFASNLSNGNQVWMGYDPTEYRAPEDRDLGDSYYIVFTNNGPKKPVKTNLRLSREAVNAIVTLQGAVDVDRYSYAEIRTTWKLVNDGEKVSDDRSKRTET